MPRAVSNYGGDAWACGHPSRRALLRIALFQDEASMRQSARGESSDAEVMQMAWPKHRVRAALHIAIANASPGPRVMTAERRPYLMIRPLRVTSFNENVDFTRSGVMPLNTVALRQGLDQQISISTMASYSSIEEAGH
jgi:hypothetical protein